MCSQDASDCYCLMLEAMLWKQSLGSAADDDDDDEDDDTDDDDDDDESRCCAYDVRFSLVAYVVVLIL